MAMDEAILWSVSQGKSPPTLRIYSWEPACLSLGRAQPASDVDHERLQALGYTIVRRPSGGRSILHVDELTYSVSLHSSDPVARGGVLPVYHRLSEALLAGLEGLDLAACNDVPASRSSAARAVCFEQHSHHEITVAARKLLGSAQWRQGDGVLQHGSLPLYGDIARICDVLAFATSSDRERARRRVRQRAVTLSEALGRKVEWDQLIAVVMQGFSNSLELQLQPGELSADEQKLAARLRAQKYAQSAWTQG